MENTFTKIEEFTAHLKEYVNLRIDAVKLDTAEKSSKLISNLITAAIVVFVLLLFLLFASISLAFVFAKITGEYYWGFLIVAGIYLLMGLLVWLLREQILRIPIMNAMLQQLFKAEEDDEEN